MSKRQVLWRIYAGFLESLLNLKHDTELLLVKVSA